MCGGDWEEMGDGGLMPSRFTDDVADQVQSIILFGLCTSPYALLPGLRFRIMFGPAVAPAEPKNSELEAIQKRLAAAAQAETLN